MAGKHRSRHDAPSGYRGVRRKFRLSNLIVGALAIAGSIGATYMFISQRRIPFLFVPTAAIAVVGGLLAVAKPFGDACERCGRFLGSRGLRFGTRTPDAAAASLRGGDVAGAFDVLGPTATDGEAYVEFLWCPSCRAVALWKSGTEEVVLVGSPASELIERFATPQQLEAE